MAKLARVNPTEKGKSMSKKRRKGRRGGRKHGKKSNPSHGKKHRRKHGKRRNPSYSGGGGGSVMSLVKEGVGLGLGVVGVQVIGQNLIPSAYRTGTTGALAQAAVGVLAGMAMKRVSFLRPYARGVQLGGIIAATNTLVAPVVVPPLQFNLLGARDYMDGRGFGAFDQRTLTMGAHDTRTLTLGARSGMGAPYGATATAGLPG